MRSGFRERFEERDSRNHLSARDVKLIGSFPNTLLNQAITSMKKLSTTTFPTI